MRVNQRRPPHQRPTNKKVDGPKKAEELPEIPDEIGQLFEMILGTIGLGMKRYVFVEDQARVRDSPNVFP
jgi:hypothetical protein